MTDPDPREDRPDASRPEQTISEREGVGASERAALLAGTTAQLVESTRLEARAWERVAHAARNLRSVNVADRLRREVLLAFIAATHMPRALAFARESGPTVAPERVGVFEDREIPAIETACRQVVEGLHVSERIDWVDAVLDHPAFAVSGEPPPRTASALVVRLHRPHETDVVLYLDAPDRRGRPPGGELRALEFLAAEAELAISTLEERARDAHATEELAGELERLRYDLGRRSAIGSILGQSPAIVAIREQLLRIAAVEAPVLVVGGAGSGKTHVARALHAAGRFCRGPMVRMASEALTPAHVHEMFTSGASGPGEVRSTAALAAASGGMRVFADVDRLPPASQISLERHLASLSEDAGREQAPGRGWPFRLVAATSADLDVAARDGRFRSSLLGRLSALRLELPPLQSRGDDVLILARAFLGESAGRHGKALEALSKEAEAVLQRRQWPGNVRELRDAVERAVALAGHERELGADALATGVALPKVPDGRLREQTESFERVLIDRALTDNGWNISQTARYLGISRQHLHNLIRKHALRR
jgi:DNA-binding NtrC family response regulator